MKNVVMLVVLTTITAAYCASQDKKVSVRVEISADRKNYVVGDKLRFTALLINTGRSSVYVAKQFSRAGGGIAGFHVSVKQLSGTQTNTVNCEGFGDRAPVVESRSPQQIIEEDFILLPPGGIVGFRSGYGGCAVEHPGKYEMAAEYLAQDLNIEKIPKGTKLGDVLTGRVASDPFRFRVHESSDRSYSQ
jgi:hypothetical protein